MSTRVHWHHCWRGSRICENGGDVCWQSNTSHYTLGLSPSCFISSLKVPLPKQSDNRTSGESGFTLKYGDIDAYCLLYRHWQPEEPHSLVKLYHSVTGPEHGKWRQNVPPTLSPSQPFLARHATPFPFPWKEHYVMRQKTTARVERLLSALTRQQGSLPLFHENPQYEIYGHFQGFSRAEKRGRILMTFTGSDQNILRIERFPKRSRSKT